jgi:UDP-GlcNAc:undecaprenyl-phosphate GlcNAc-1-phosphate transferase
MTLDRVLIVLGAAALLSALATGLLGRLGERLGLVALPGGRRQHARPIARTGGMGLFVGFFTVAVGLFLFAPLKPEHTLPLIGVISGSGLVFLVGALDDRYELQAGPQFLAQLAASAIAIGTTVWIQEVTLPGQSTPTVFPWFITYPLTVFWIVGMMNTVNFVDGLDGLAAGVGAIAAALFAIHSWRLGQPEIALYSVALAGACLGFLAFNFYPARTFLGSAGAMVLGYALATLSILAPARVATAVLVMAIPIADVAFQIVDRWRRGQSPLQGDRGHLHFRLADLGLPHWQIVLGYWGLCALFGATALLTESRIMKLAAIGVLGLAVVLLLALLNRRRPSTGG